MERASFLCFDAMLTHDDKEQYDKFIMARDAYLELEPCEKVFRELGSILNRLGDLEYVAEFNESSDEYYEKSAKFYKQSAEYYEKSVKLNPSPHTLCYFAETCVKLKDERAPYLFIDAIELGSKRACLHYGMFLHKNKQFPIALFFYRLALKDDEELSLYLRAKVIFNIGFIYHERFINEKIQSHYDEAEKNYEESIQMLVDGQEDANILLPILRSGSVIDFWNVHKNEFY
jgi:tetratricopeptide (TPR) repeat protein